MLPFTSSICTGRLKHRIPTVPDDTMRILSVLFVLKTNALLSFVPKKFVGGLVLLFPVSDQLCANDVVTKTAEKTASIVLLHKGDFLMLL